MATPPPRLPLITVLGSLNMDLVAYVPHHPVPGETLTADRFATSPGGKGANQAVACAKLSRARPASFASSSSQTQQQLGAGSGSGAGPAGAGGADSAAATTATATATARVSMVGRVGADAHGAALRAGLAAFGVDVRRVAVVAAPGVDTGVALIVVDVPTGENRIVLSPGANYAFLPGECWWWWW
ncbi:uncharacterized protein THITE_2129056 [Thermothielavioides terrestris NRRL 8126]|uniref:Carbohydrate kinase PfkB domain-containing protein n=1 Tax=Thermothielavioides terrestris (strain ATCC 38088 / NRRL 8126) TaxID=578455 RepID=G2QYW5_THETT|nr:uncharacterized protein THITE_2129056 [Thermothielavioides terrestris NRRL 8126]AEO67104.1 hypothetical protein THITE_2129056 [Thermothielavioides terrestris NRRL 8126]